MMPTVISAARAGAPRPDSTKGLAATPPRKLRRENECVVMGNTPWLAVASRRTAMANTRNEAVTSKRRLRRVGDDHRFPLALGFASALDLGSRATLVELL